ncbi:MAG TPA: CPBP family intramembrane glutamic endopeptidase [Hyphomicrobiaceae bacterium]|nr:CPBP family intramembrane glutamic endopeptidase [Hyphomicrobiaceae bacterium]
MTLSAFILGQPRYSASTPWRPGWAIAAAVLMFLAAQFVAAALFPWIEEVSPSQLPPTSGSPTSIEPGAIEALMVWLLLIQVTVVALVLVAASLFGGDFRRVLQLDHIDGGARSIGYAILLMAVLLGAFNILVYVLGQSEILADMQLYAAFMHSDSWAVAAVAIGLGAPLMEELLFRGFLLSALAQTRFGFPAASVLTTLAWAALHWGYSFVGLLEVCLVGLYFCWLLWRTGSLWPALICHAAYNSFLMLLLRFVDIPT